MAQTKLKGHTSLWWKEVQRNRQEEGELKITRWKLMMTKLKAKLIPSDCELELFKSLQNLKQKDMFVKDYIEKSYKLYIRFGHRELSKEKVARYINGSRFNIHDETGMLKIDQVEDAYQYAPKAKDKLKRRHQGNSQGKKKHEHLVKDKQITEDEPKPIEQRR